MGLLYTAQGVAGCVQGERKHMPHDSSNACRSVHSRGHERYGFAHDRAYLTHLTDVVSHLLNSNVLFNMGPWDMLAMRSLAGAAGLRL